MSFIGIFKGFSRNLYDFFTPPRGRVRKSTHQLPFWEMSGTSQPPEPQFRSLLVNPWDPKFTKIRTRPYGALSGVLLNHWHFQRLHKDCQNLITQWLNAGYNNTLRPISLVESKHREAVTRNLLQHHDTTKYYHNRYHRLYGEQTTRGSSVPSNLAPSMIHLEIVGTNLEVLLSPQRE